MHPEYFQEVTFCFKKKFPISAGNYYVFFFSLAKDRLVSKKFDLLFLLTLIVLLTITGNNYILYLLYLSRSLNIKKCAITCEISDWVSLLDAWVDVKCTKSCHLPVMQLLIWEGWNNVIFNFEKQLLLVIWVLCPKVPVFQPWPASLIFSWVRPWPYSHWPCFTHCLLQPANFRLKKC